MIALIQRVASASVSAESRVVGEIGLGLAVLVGVERDDADSHAETLAERVVAYRVFADESGRMNRSVRDVGGALLLVPQFTLAADTSSGLRPSFSRAAEPAVGKRLFERFVAATVATGVPTACGVFGAHMQVALTNDGPVTFWLTTGPAGAS